jgi:hypothetical protein
MTGSDTNMQSLYEEIARIEKKYLFEDQHLNCACKKKTNRLKKTFTRINSFDNEYLQEKYQIDRKANILELTMSKFRDNNRRNAITPLAVRSIEIAKSLYVLKDIEERIKTIDSTSESMMY